jgi:hypothetical protein
MSIKIEVHATTDFFLVSPITIKGVLITKLGLYTIKGQQYWVVPVLTTDTLPDDPRYILEHQRDAGDNSVYFLGFTADTLSMGVTVSGISATVFHDRSEAERALKIANAISGDCYKLTQF